MPIPLIRFGTGDMSPLLAGPSRAAAPTCAIKGWMGRADQRTKVRGMFVDPEQMRRNRQEGIRNWDG